MADDERHLIRERIAKRHASSLCSWCIGAPSAATGCRRRVPCEARAPEAFAESAEARAARGGSEQRIAEAAAERARRAGARERARLAAADAVEAAAWAAEDAELAALKARGDEVARAVTASVDAWREAAARRQRLPPAWSVEREVDPRVEARLVAFQRSACGRR